MQTTHLLKVFGWNDCMTKCSFLSTVFIEEHTCQRSAAKVNLAGGQVRWSNSPAVQCVGRDRQTCGHRVCEQCLSCYGDQTGPPGNYECPRCGKISKTHPEQNLHLQKHDCPATLSRIRSVTR
ncbi:hypothetical protein DPEC_G00195850 [Dallia pectoralis]|uniref:Uncharacterized protein n=1 Tax=Dallia pectoralis TaxID=75939 RepID=A0ACC2G7L5_DALPE|nr:hypothetical protein DPEC_G00195850 [Dallia pectoralis]